MPAPIWYAVPLGEMATHGSLARWNVPPLHLVNRAKLVVQVWPPSKVAAVTSPLAPPFDQRSCCQMPIKCFALPGFTAAYGSTSALGNATPPGPAGPRHALLFQGAVPETVTKPAPGSVCGPAGGSSQAQQNSSSAAARRIRRG